MAYFEDVGAEPLEAETDNLPAKPGGGEEVFT
jgi:hypothetical protein